MSSISAAPQKWGDYRGSAIYARKSPFDRHLRELQTACQHLVGQSKGLENVGSLLLGGQSGHALI